MRFWVWARRPNSTYRVLRPLSREEEGLQLMDLRDHRDAHVSRFGSCLALLLGGVGCAGLDVPLGGTVAPVLPWL